jgi:hypothetical protein
MAGKKETAHGGTGRVHWLDEKTDAPQIQEYASKLSTFLEAIADGVIDDRELKDQEARLVALMKTVEPQLSDALHGEVTQLLCELTAYNIMHTVHDLARSRPKTRFRG